MNKKGNNPTSKKSKVLIVDDHPVVRKGLTYLIDKEPDLKVCGECEEGADVIPKIMSLGPDAVILDLFLKDAHGVDLLRDLNARFPNLPVLVLSMHEESLYAERVLRAGGMGYVSKDNMLDKVVLALRTVLRGEVYAGDAIKSKLLRQISKPSGPTGDATLDKLSDRELEVFQLLGQGYSTRRIAERWGRSIKTVETYRAHIKSKLNLVDSADLMRCAVEWMQKRKQP